MDDLSKRNVERSEDAVELARCWELYVKNIQYPVFKSTLRDFLPKSSTVISWPSEWPSVLFCFGANEDVSYEASERFINAVHAWEKGHG